MKIDFIPLANVPTVESLTDSAKVLVIDSGEVKKTAKSNIAGGGGGEATIENIEVTNVLPNGKTLHHFDYFTYLSEEGGQIECLAENSLAFPFVSGNPTYIQLTSGESTDGDYMRASNIAVTGDIEADGEYLTISGEGTVTITWVIV